MVISGPQLTREGVDQVTFSKANGSSFTVVAEGFRPFVEGMFAAYALSADEVVLERSGATARLEAKFNGALPGQTEVPVTVIDLATEDLTQSLYLHEDYATLHTDTVRLVRDFVTNGQSRDEFQAALKALLKTPSGLDAEGLLAQELYDYLMNGTDSFVTPVFAVSRTRTVSSRYSSKVDQTNAGKVFTTAQLAAILGTTLLFDVPEIMVSAEEVARFPGLRAGWRKKSIQVRSLANRQWEMIEGWALAKWTKHYKDAVIA